jgi:D-alanine transaminase
VPKVLGKQRAREKCLRSLAGRSRRNGQRGDLDKWLVPTSDATEVTREADSPILNGITRALAVLDIIRREGYSLVERPFSVAEALSAREAFLTSTTVDLLPVVRIDGVPMGNRQPGPLSRQLRECYLAHSASMASA